MKKILILVIAVIMAILLTGCGGDNIVPKKVNAAIVIGTHANGGGVPIYSEELVDSVRSVCLTYGHISMVSSEGSPAVIGDYDIPEPAKDGLSEAKLQHIVEEYVTQLLPLIANHTATSEEVDTIEAITLAARTLTGIEGEKHMIVCDSGLSTTGYLNFAASDILHSSPDAIIEELTKKQAIPSLDEVNVVWIGLGDVSLPQETLSAKEKDNLRTIWQGILEESGASVKFSSALPAGAKEGLPYVTPVPVEGVRSVSVLSEPITLDDTQVGFIGDTAQYRDSKTAIETLTPVAQALKEAPQMKILIVGTTATGREDFCRKLSEDRALTVKSTLIDLGVDENQILKAVGLGFHDPWHVDDRNGNGYLIESLAVENRKVVILDAYGEGVSKILEEAMVH